MTRPPDAGIRRLSVAAHTVTLGPAPLDRSAGSQLETHQNTKNEDLLSPPGAPVKIGLFGGTFDPPHIGHLVAAQELHVELGLHLLLLVPASVPPHKMGEAVTPAAIRLEMLRAAAADDPRFEVSDMEVSRPGPSYTIETLRALRDEHPGAELLLAMGADQLVDLESWREPEEIGRLATIVAFARSGEAVPEDPKWPVRRVEVPEIHVSSTDIRHRVATGRPITYLVPAATAAIIQREALYR
jgi:nicotinate-nucleotide adenylyltransferase